MIGKVFGALVGGRLAKETTKIGGTTGAAIGAAVPFVISRMSIPAMIAMGVGGYVVKRYFEKKEPQQATTTDMEPSQPASIPQPTAA